MLLIDIYMESPLYVNGIQYSDYIISTNGEIYSMLSNKKLSISKYKKGYMYINLKLGDNTKKCKIHRLVAMTFIPIPKKYLDKGLSYDDLEVNHCDGNKSNNCVYNLEWCTHNENIKHAFDSGLCDNRSNIGENCNFAKITDDIVLKCCEMLSNNKPIKEISKVLNISEDTIYHINNRKTWTHISKNFEFPRLMNKVSDDSIHMICKLLEENILSNSQIANIVGCSSRYIRNIKNRERRTDISNYYKF